MGYSYAVIGAGRQGVSAAYDLARFGSADRIALLDINGQAAQHGADRINRLLDVNIAEGHALDVRDASALGTALSGINATVSAVPYLYNLDITEAAIEAGSHLCDLGGHTETVRQQMTYASKAEAAGITLTPDCGMAPGLNINLGVYAISQVEQPESLSIYDGGLPQEPRPPWNYASTFNINGLTNEYFGDAWFIRNSKPTEVECLTEIEIVEFDSPLGTLEAAVTSGGLSTSPWTLQNQLQSLENKTLRYPGHWQTFEAYKRLGLFEMTTVNMDGTKLVPREFFHTLLAPKITFPQVKDICVIRAECRGLSQGKPDICRVDLIDTFDEDTGFTAMEKITGWHASTIAILSAQGELKPGAVAVENTLTGERLLEEINKRGWQLAVSHPA